MQPDGDCEHVKSIHSTINVFEKRVNTVYEPSGQSGQSLSLAVSSIMGLGILLQATTPRDHRMLIHLGKERKSGARFQ